MPFSIFSAKVLESFNTKYLNVKGKTYIDIQAEAPYEFFGIILNSM